MGDTTEICVPDIGDFESVEVVEILIAKGDRVELEDPVVSVESDKATMEIPSTASGLVVEVCVAEGDLVSEGSRLVVVEADQAQADSGKKDASEPPSKESAGSKAETAEKEAPTPSEARSDADAKTDRDEARETADAVAPSAPVGERAVPMSTAAANPVPDRAGHHHASPLVRRFARELGVPLEHAEGTGPLGRILVDDLKQTVRARFEGDRAGSTTGAANAARGGAPMVPPIPAVDFSAFGPIHETPLTRIQKVAGPNLHRSWLNVPHVTQHDEADVTELERFRRERRSAAEERGLKLSPLLFVMKAMVVALREFPSFRSSLAPEGDRLIIKDFYHLGIAVDTEQGLVVPVIRDVDQKGIFELADEVSQTAERARNKKLTPDDLRGAVTTISSLGGIGGRAFSPIVNAPEVAILGLSKTRVQPVWRGPLPSESSPSEPASLEASPADAAPGGQGTFEPRLVMPISLSYDHRVIDGAEAVRFTTRLATILADPYLLLL